jgi:hypothetical protein
MKKLLLSVAFISATFIGANAQTVLSQTTSSTPADGTSIACAPQDGSGISDNKYFRAYTIDSDFTIGAVQVGIETVLGGPFALDVKLYTSATSFPGSYPAGLTEIASTTYNLDDQELTTVDIPISASVSAGSTLVVEVSHPDVAGALFYIGANSAGQSAPGYILSEGCGISTPTPFSGIGFADVHIIINVVEGTASTEDFASNFSVYPNPATNVINVANSADVINNVTITDLNGRTVKQVTVGVNDAQINISDLAQGVYILNATSNGKSFTQKIVKQ